jgi:hypothetical protein
MNAGSSPHLGHLDASIVIPIPVRGGLDASPLLGVLPVGSVYEHVFLGIMHDNTLARLVPILAFRTILCVAYM